MQPNLLKVRRATTIASLPENVFEQFNDFENWVTWLPLEKLDPAMKNEISGSPSGKAVDYHWMGNENLGAGQMTIVESRPNSHIKIDSDFIKPFTQKSVAGFTFKANDDTTHVTGTISVQNNFLSKAFGVSMASDKMVGTDFESGLAQLKLAAEQN